MGISFKFTAKNSEAMNKLSRMMERAKKESSKTTEEACIHWAKNISWFLYVESVKHEHSYEWYADRHASLGEALGWKIANFKKGVKQPSLVSKGKTPYDGPTGSRKNHAMLVLEKRAWARKFMASGWLQVKRIVQGDKEKLVEKEKVNGKVEVKEVPKLVGKEFEVSIINTSPQAKKFHEQYGITEKALEATRIDIAEYLAMKRKKTVEEILKEE